MKHDKKIVFVGSVGSGKSTMVRNLSSVPVITSEVGSTTDIGKATTTVGIDYGYINLDEHSRISLYGVPGQRKFSFIWDHTCQGFWGLVILVRNNDHKSIQELDYLLDYFSIDKHSPLIVCLTHCDVIKSEQAKNMVQNTLFNRGLNVPVYSINANLKRNAELIIQTITAMEESSFE